MEDPAGAKTGKDCRVGQGTLSVCPLSGPQGGGPPTDRSPWAVGMPFTVFLHLHLRVSTYVLV